MSSSKLIMSRSFVSRSLSRRQLSSQPSVSVSHAVTNKNSGVGTIPSSVYSIPTGSASIGQSNVVIRDVGCCRRVFLLEPHMTAVEIEGLAYRIRALTKNEAVNSILVATSNDDDALSGALPTSAIEIDKIGQIDADNDSMNPEDTIFYVAGGYDPVEIAKAGTHKDSAAIQHLLQGLGDLALATRGDMESTRIPVITIPHGLVHDGGYALCMGGYVLATPDTSFRVMNPSRGLTFDPIGLSFMLPRLGWESQQDSAEYVGCGLLLALTGMEANASDMMETGMATHFMDTIHGLPMLERSLAEIPPWNQQDLLKKRPRFYGQPERQEDVNANYRNVAVANLIHCFSNYNISGTDMFTNRESDFMAGDDPSLHLDYTPLHAKRESDLVNYAATFDQVFRDEKTVAGILKRFKEIAARESLDEDVKEGIAVAKDLVERMEKQSPLALSVTYSLMQLGAKKGESLETCMDRERRAQAKLFQQDDFENWAKHAAASNDGEAFSDWSHATLADVPQDQVDEIVGN